MVGRNAANGVDNATPYHAMALDTTGTTYARQQPWDTFETRDKNENEDEQRKEKYTPSIILPSRK